MLPAQPNQSLIDGLACLQLLAGSGQPVGSRELARLLGLEPTRVNRLLKTLAHLGLAQQGDDRKYRPGPAVHVLAAQAMFGSGLLRRALPALEPLHRLGHLVALGVLWRDRVSYLYHADPGMPAAAAVGRVGLFPAAESGLGLAVLALRPLTEARALLRPGCTGAALDAALDAVRRAKEAGYAVSPRRSGRITVAVALAPTTSAAIGVSGDLVPRDVPAVAAALRAAADQINAAP